MTTIRDIARLCKVSPTTVSLVLNNRPGQVSDQTRDKVLKAVRAHNYRPRTRIAPTDSKVVQTLGVGTNSNASNFSSPGYSNSILHSILTAAEQQELNITLLHKKAIYRDEKQGIRAHIDGQCDGILLIAPFTSSPLVTLLEERGIPFVLIGDQGDGAQILSVDIDNITEAKKLVDHLIALGHRRIAFIGGLHLVRSSNLRYEGYLNALKEANIPFDPSLAVAFNNEIPVPYEIARRMMQRPVRERPTAFFCWNDNVALRVLFALSDMSIAVPQRVSVIGIDDSHEATMATPGLTTLRQPYRAIGAKAVDMLIARINGETSVTRPFYLPADLVLRDSTAPPPK